eukprot:scaffold226551_cov21-Tisochrysis_lutea.AAC.2
MAVTAYGSDAAQWLWYNLVILSQFQPMYPSLSRASILCGLGCEAWSGTMTGRLQRNLQASQRACALHQSFRRAKDRLLSSAGIIDYDGLEKSAQLFRPKMIIAGASAYSRLGVTLVCCTGQAPSQDTLDNWIDMDMANEEPAGCAFFGSVNACILVKMILHAWPPSPAAHPREHVRVVCIYA